MPSQELAQTRLRRAYQSLQGLHCGDAFGERFFMSAQVATRLIAERSLPAPPWFFTDDTLMAVSVVATLEEHGGIDQDFLASSFALNYDSSRGYGAACTGCYRAFVRRKDIGKKNLNRCFMARALSEMVRQ